VFRKPTIEQLEGFIQPTWQALVDGAKYVEPRLREFLDELRPDVVVEDNVVGFAALPACGIPWVRIVSCNPCELKDAEVPPAFSGYAEADRAGWDEFRAEYERAHRPYDNARRVHELAYGLRLATYDHEPHELREEIDLLLTDEMLRERLRRISTRLQAFPAPSRRRR
nr:hypothetical protein [Actinomycetota bacterium]